MGKNNPRERKDKETGSNPAVSSSVSGQTDSNVSRATSETSSVSGEAFGIAASNDISGIDVFVTDDPTKDPHAKERLEALKKSLDSGAFASVATKKEESDNGDDESQDDEAPELETLTERKHSERQLKRQAKAHEAAKKSKGSIIARNLITGISVTFIVIIVILIISFCIFRWQTFNDAADMQGTWYYKNSDTSIEITEDKIVLTSDVAYTYVIDPEAKTIMYSFGYMSGQGRYRFSLDRTQLAISDGEFDFWGTFIDDAVWTVRSLVSQWFSLPAVSISEELNSIVLVREAADLDKVEPAAQPQDDGAQAEPTSDAIDDSHQDTDDASDSSASGSSSLSSSSDNSQTPGTGLDLPVNDLPNGS